MEHHQSPFVAKVTLDERGKDIHAYSDDIPGLNICGTNREDVLQDVVGAVAFLFKEVHGIDVQVELARPSAQLGRSRDARMSEELPVH
jgi:hypothetical protein